MLIKSYFKLITVSLIALTLLGCKRQLSFKELTSVLKYLSDETTSKAFYQKNLSNKLQKMNRVFHSKGETTFLNYPAYYAHYSSEISKQPRESIVFIVRGNESNFYMIVIDTGADDNYTDNMKQLLSNVKRFKLKS